MDSVREWLVKNGFGACADAFEREQISVEMLGTLTDAELVQLGLATIGDRRRLRACVERSPTSASSQPDVAAETSGPADVEVPQLPGEIAPVLGTPGGLSRPASSTAHPELTRAPSPASGSGRTVVSVGRIGLLVAFVLAVAGGAWWWTSRDARAFDDLCHAPGSANLATYPAGEQEQHLVLWVNANVEGVAKTVFDGVVVPGPEREEVARRLGLQSIDLPDAADHLERVAGAFGYSGTCPLADMLRAGQLWAPVPYVENDGGPDTSRIGVARMATELDREVEKNIGLLSALRDDAMLAGQLGNTGMNADMQVGSGGLGARGGGLGGGGTADGLGGMGTKRRGSGSSGHGFGGGDFGSKGEGGTGSNGGGPIILGALDEALIDAVIKRNMAQIRYCYQQQLKKNPTLGGKISIKFVIARDGTVSSASTKSSTMNNAAVEGCIAGRFLKFQFPEPKGGGIVMVMYPFIFSPD